jgi:hypothetical protein
MATVLSRDALGRPKTSVLVVLHVLHTRYPYSHSLITARIRGLQRSRKYLADSRVYRTA